MRITVYEKPRLIDLNTSVNRSHSERQQARLHSSNVETNEVMLVSNSRICWNGTIVSVDGYCRIGYQPG